MFSTDTYRNKQLEVRRGRLRVNRINMTGKNIMKANTKSIMSICSHNPWHGMTSYLKLKPQPKSSRAVIPASESPHLAP